MEHGRFATWYRFVLGHLSFGVGVCKTRRRRATHFALGIVHADISWRLPTTFHAWIDRGRGESDKPRDNRESVGAQPPQRNLSMTPGFFASTALAAMLFAGAEMQLKSGPPVGARNNRGGFFPQLVSGPGAGERRCPV